MSTNITITNKLELDFCMYLFLPVISEIMNNYNNCTTEKPKLEETIKNHQVQYFWRKKRDKMRLFSTLACHVETTLHPLRSITTHLLQLLGPRQNEI